MFYALHISNIAGVDMSDADMLMSGKSEPIPITSRLVAYGSFCTSVPFLH